MTTQERAEAAVEYKHNGFNCAQAVLLAHLDVLDSDKDTLVNLSSGFGSGMGCMEATCGALCGAIMTAGILMKGEKRHIFSKKMLKAFEEKSGATICKDLKGIETGKVLCSCDDCVRNGVYTVAEIMNEELGVKI